MGKRQHGLVMAFPLQGHVKPLLRLAYRIADHGIKVTFVTTQSIHDQITAANSLASRETSVALACIPDLPESEDAKGSDGLDRLGRFLRGCLKDLIEKINESESEEKASFVIADATVGWVLEVPKEMGIKHVAVWPGGPGCPVLLRHIPKLIEAGFIDKDGIALRSDMFRVSVNIPPWGSNEFSWRCPDQIEKEKITFRLFQTIKQATELPSWLLCNTFHELHPEISRFVPNLLPIGPLLDSKKHNNCNGSLHLEDKSSLNWLDGLRPRSVVYVSFGSIAKFTQQQFDELALGLELSGRLFLWVVRPDTISESTVKYPNGFKERMSGLGRIVEWAPQEEVLAHPSIACFFTHCGWNSVMEGLTAGVPFLCLPYFTDQFHNRNFICDNWKVGLKLNSDDKEIISRYDIKTKIDQLLMDRNIKENALKLKEMACRSISEGGSSSKNFETFIKFIEG
ncbi:hypothetical protein NMG60_11004176 [Bertholletia excelsa]